MKRLHQQGSEVTEQEESKEKEDITMEERGLEEETGIEAPNCQPEVAIEEKELTTMDSF